MSSRTNAIMLDAAGAELLLAPIVEIVSCETATGLAPACTTVSSWPSCDQLLEPVGDNFDLELTGGDVDDEVVDIVIVRE